MDIENDAAGLYLDLMKQALTASLYDESAWQMDGSNSKNLFKNYMVKRLKRTSRFVIKKRDYDPKIREEGRDWPFFGYAMTGHRRLENVRACVEDVLKNEIAGDLVEAGVWRGGTTIFMRALLKAYGVTDRKVWVADSFEGMPEAKDEDDGWDLSDVEALAVSIEQVKSNFERFDLLDDQVEFLKGWFCDTLPGAPIGEIAVLRLDGDMYSSTMDTLESLYTKVSKGGYVIVDDYYAWPACKRAVTDYIEKNNVDADIQTVDWTGAFWQV